MKNALRSFCYWFPLYPVAKQIRHQTLYQEDYSQNSPRGICFHKSKKVCHLQLLYYLCGRLVSSPNKQRRTSSKKLGDSSFMKLTSEPKKLMIKNFEKQKNCRKSDKEISKFCFEQFLIMMKKKKKKSTLTKHLKLNCNLIPSPIAPTPKTNYPTRLKVCNNWRW